MRQLTTYLEIGRIDFPFCNKVSIESTYENLTDTATVVVPKKVIFKDESGNNVENIAKGEDALFKVGDPVYFNLGYDHRTELRFTGVITKVKTKYPLEFSFEDEMYTLKQTTNTFALKNPKLSALIKKIMPEGIDYEITADQNLGDFRATNATSSSIIEELRKKHGIYSFFRDGKLYIGLAIVPKLQKTVRFEMFRDIINAKSLEFVNSFDRKIKVVAKSITSSNKQLEYETGDQDGETRTVYLYGVESMSDLKKKADSMINELKYDGYDGSFTTFLTPSVNHGDIVEIINPQIPEQSGGYIANKVVTTSGVGGGRQTITIKQKIYDL